MPCRTQLLVLALAIVAVGCERGGPVARPGSADSGRAATESADWDTIVAGPDVAEFAGAAVDPPADLGAPCSKNLDCERSLCVDARSGFVCSMFCVTECPDGWSCVALMLRDSDASYACFPDCTARADSDATCDGQDDDCDGLTDEDALPQPIECGAGACASAGQRVCEAGTWVEACTPTCDAPACLLATACTPGSAVACAGACGPGLRTCGADCTLGPCSAPEVGECTPGQQEELPCGSCKRVTRSCDATCTWGEFGPCQASPDCDPKCLAVYPDNCRPFVISLPPGTQARTVTWWPAYGGATDEVPVSAAGGVFSSPYGVCAGTLEWSGETPSGTATVCGVKGTVPLCDLPLGGYGATHDGKCKIL